MNLTFVKGRFFIDGKEVYAVVYQTGETTAFPINSTEQITLTTDTGTQTIDVKGNNNSVGMVIGSNIKCGGNFTLGDTIIKK